MKTDKSLIFANEAYGFYREKNKMGPYTELLTFIDKNVGVDSMENSLR
ncbi:hypothetical protein Misp06_03163 [Microbulbifer sp. NBRC 101763]